jgi:signal transduction histidine kinase/CheY-like chemotaxis protein
LSLLLWLVPAQSWANNWDISINSALNSPIEIATRIKLILDDKEALLTPLSAEKIFENSAGELPRSVSVSHRDTELGRIENPVWARFSISNTAQSSVELVLAHRQPTIEKHEIFIKQGEKNGWLKHLGRHELARTAFQRNHEPTYDLTVSPGQKIDVLVRWATYAPIKAPIALYSREGHNTSAQWQMMFFTASFSIPILCVVALLLVNRVSNVKIDGLLIGFVAADLIGATWITGTTSIFFPLLDGALLRQIGHISYAFLSLLAALHATKFLELDSLKPRWALALRSWALIGAAIVIGATFISLYSSSIFILVFSFSTAIIVTVICLYARSQGVPFAGSYSLAWSIYSATALIYIFYRLQMLPLEALGVAMFWQNAGVCLVLSGTVMLSVYSRDTRLKDALLLADLRRRQLETLNLERDRLFAAASHDLRQPLQAIGLNLGLLTPKSSADLAISERIRLAIVSMSDILSSLLDLRRASGDAKAITLEPVALQPLLDRLCQDYREQARIKQLSFRNVATGTWAQADPIWLERCLRNLITNALRYTDDGRVLLGVRRYGKDKLKISVLDTGRGLQQEQLARINAADIASPNPELRDSYGLGLYIVKRLCEQMQAQLSVRSLIDRGSTFEIIVNRHHPDVQIVSTPKTRSRVKTLRQSSVLVVDDDSELLGLVTTQLKALGAYVVACASVDQARGYLGLRNFDIVLTDYNFGPGRPTGIDLLKSCPSHTKTCVMTGQVEFLQTAPMVAILADKAAISLAKPFSMPILAQILTKLLNDDELPVK